MGQTLTEKILAVKSGKKRLSPGEIVEVTPDKVFSHDIFSPTVIDEFKEMGRELKNQQNIILIIDHELPATSENAAAGYLKTVEFAQKNQIEHFYFGEGVCHVVIPEKGHIKPGDVIIGTDSHTVTYGAISAFSTGVGSTEMAAIWATGKTWLKVPGTIKIQINGELKPGVYSKDLILHLIGKLGSDGLNYKAVEFCGDTITALSMEARFTMTNMVVEMGAKNGIIGFDQKTEAYLTEKGISEYPIYTSDSSAQYEKQIVIDAGEILPQLSGPDGVDQVQELKTLKGKKITQGFIGSCTNGRLEDLRIAAGLLQGKQVAPYVKLIVTPASKQIYRDAIKEGLIETFLEAGAVVTNPCCSLCYGVSGGVLGKEDVAVCSNNRNFPGRMGHKMAEVYLASPATVAASSIAGELIASTDLKETLIQ